VLGYQGGITETLVLFLETRTFRLFLEGEHRLVNSSKHYLVLLVCAATASTLSGCGGVNGSALTPSSAGLAATQPHASVKYKLLYSFSGRGKNGYGPFARLIAVNGTLYGTTGYGGTKGLGTVFTITTSGKETTLHSFSGYDGNLPLGGLIDIDGTLYGTTGAGGHRGSCSNDYCGTFYSMTLSGKEKVLHNFDGTDGAEPDADLIDVNGTLYSTTIAGGANGSGTVYAIKTSGKERVLYSFGSLGNTPRAGLIDVNGTFYGTTEFGGKSGCGGNGCGTVFSMTASGTVTALYEFAGGADGAGPNSGLIDVGGVLYGTTENGGGGGCTNLGCGTVFSITPSGKETILHRFSGEDGSLPWAGLTKVKSTLYGTTLTGGARGLGTIFSITRSGQETVLHSFATYGDGSEPFGALLNVKGTLYGTTDYGGAYGEGSVFKLTP
jgi:uncharacterized repeat protein (TIGR03803 family)